MEHHVFLTYYMECLLLSWTSLHSAYLFSITEKNNILFVLLQILKMEHSDLFTRYMEWLLVYVSWHTLLNKKATFCSITTNSRWNMMFSSPVTWNVCLFHGIVTQGIPVVYITKEQYFARLLEILNGTSCFPHPLYRMLACFLEQFIQYITYDLHKKATFVSFINLSWNIMFSWFATHNAQFYYTRCTCCLQQEMPDPCVGFYCQGSWQGLLGAGGCCCWGLICYINCSVY